MHVRGVVYWCLLSFYLCKCDQLDPVRVEDVGTAKKSDGASARGSPAGSNPHQQRSTSTSFAALSEAVSHAASHEISLLEACNEDMACLTMAAQDRAGLEAIQMLHRQLDDDANGNVDLSESDDFLREELQYDSGYERRQQAFHRNDDMHISVKELWEAWLRSEVHNWTVEQTTEWLAQNVELPQYIGTFLQHHVTGATLPRLAVNNMQYLSNILGIKDPIHKQKIALKAMDVVLFGPPKDSARWKDVLLLMLVVGAIGGGWAAVRASRASRRQLRRMLQDMEQLRRAEVALDDLQRELERARAEQENVNTEKQNLERRLREAGDAPHLSAVCSDLEVSQLKAEIEMLRSELRRAEGELEDRCWAPPVGLQQWLQLTHEVENRSYMRKKNAADLQLQQAREACEKLRKKRSSLVGAFVSTHGKSIDDVDRSIVEARTALNEVTQELQERVQRWKQIEMLCGFNIINNNGLQYLENALYRTPNGRPGRFRMSNSQDDLSLDDAASLYGGAAGGAGGATAQDGPFWREDSSGSEDHESPHYPLDLKLAEARAQLEERLAWEARSASIDDYNKRLRSDETRRYIDDMKRQLTDRSSMLDVRRNGVDEKRPMDDKRLPDDKRPSEDSRKQPAVKDPVQFTLGGDNVNWPNEEAPRSAQSQPQLRTAPPAPSNTTSSIPRSTSGPQQITALPSMPQPPPRRPHTAPNVGAMVRSRSTDVVLSSPEEPRVPPRATFTRQRTVAEEISQPGASSPSNSTLSMASNPEDEGEATSTDSSLLDEDAKPRRRKILFPFVKSKSKVGHS